LVKKGLATMARAIEEASEAPGLAYVATLGKVINDAKLVLVDIMTSILDGLIKPHFEAHVLPLCLEPIKPVDEMIPSEIKTFITVESVVKNLINATVNGAISSVVTALAAPGQKQLDELETSLKED
jgi:hypothetical protein